MDGWTDGRTDGRMDGWIDGLTVDDTTLRYRYIHMIYTHIYICNIHTYKQINKDTQGAVWSSGFRQQLIRVSYRTFTTSP